SGRSPASPTEPNQQPVRGEGGGRRAPPGTRDHATSTSPPLARSTLEGGPGATNSTVPRYPALAYQPESPSPLRPPPTPRTTTCLKTPTGPSPLPTRQPRPHISVALMLPRLAITAGLSAAAFAGCGGSAHDARPTTAGGLTVPAEPPPPIAWGLDSNGVQ